MIKKVMFILFPVWTCMLAVLIIIDMKCMYKAILTFDTVDCCFWILYMFSLTILTAGMAIIPILMYNDFKE